MKPIDELASWSRQPRIQTLSERIAAILAKLLSPLFDSVSIPDSFPTKADGNFSVVILDKSIILDAILLSISKRRGFSGIASARTALSVRDPNSLYRADFRDEKNLAALLIQDEDHKFITFNVIYGSGPIKTTRNYSINFWDSLSLILLKNSLSVACGEPRKIKTVQGSLTRNISRILKVDFYGSLKVIRGTPFQPIRVQAESVLSGDDYEAECERIAKDRDISQDKVKRLNQKAFFEIAANPARWVHLLVGNLAKLIIWHLFPTVKVEGLPNFVASSKNNPTVIVPVHRSHLDYILLGSVLFKSRLNTPLVAAGINLNFWPVGFFLRRVGAFFVKRTGGSDPVHVLVLRRYVTYLLKRGHLLEFFIEGGRSRTGRMRSPKLGLLKAIVAAHQKGLRKDVAFVPVSISYEQVIEDKALAQENRGGKKVEENVKSLISARSILGRTYGEVIVKFHNPIFLSKYSAATGKLRGNLVSSLAQHLTDQMRAGTNPTLTALASTSIMMTPKYCQSAENLFEGIKILSRLVDIHRSVDARIGPNSKTLDTVVNGTVSSLKQLIASGLLEGFELSGLSLYHVPEHKRLRTDFYKNATIHLFIPFALIEVSRTEDNQINWETLKRLYALLESDYLLPNEEEMVELCKKLSSDPKYLELLTLTKSNLPLAQVLLPTFELYRWILNELQKLVLNWQDSSTARVPFDSFVGQLVQQNESAMKAGLVNRTEAFSRASIESCLEGLSSRGLISAPPARRGPRSIRVILDLKDELNFINGITERLLLDQAFSLREYHKNISR